jgi:hypothetical protein
MARLTCIFIALLGFSLCNVFAYPDQKINLFGTKINRCNQKPAPADQPLALLTADVDEVSDGASREKTIDTEEARPEPPREKKPKMENRQESRMVPMTPAPPSEKIKADQEVDFPYDI